MIYVIIMVKAIVLYNSRGGNTRKVAMKIAEGVGCEAIDNKHIPDLKDYDLVIVGSWCLAGRISFSGARYLRKLHRKHISEKKIALFFTSGAPDDINPMTEDKIPKTIKECMWEWMEKILQKNNDVTILEDRFYAKGALRMFKKGKPKHYIGHPSEEELTQAKEFGEKLRSQF